MRQEHVGAAIPTDFLRASPRKYRGVPDPGTPVVPMPLHRIVVGWVMDNTLTENREQLQDNREQFG